MNIQLLGLDSYFQESFCESNHPNLVLARVLCVYNHLYRIAGDFGECLAVVSGKLKDSALSPIELPTVGDWVRVRLENQSQAVIHSVVPRRTVFYRNVAGTKTEKQSIAANIDTVIIVVGLDHDFNLRRIERYLTAIWGSGASAWVVLNKADLQEDVEYYINEVDSVAFGIPTFAISAKTGWGLNVLKAAFQPYKTYALVGSSGAGKSSLLNALGLDLKTQEVRENDSRGRHTTTRRELFILENGALFIDTPGMRELRLWVGEESVENNFSDIVELAKRCRFRDCRHENEPECAVRDAIDNGALHPKRWNNYQKQRREVAYIESLSDEQKMRDTKERWKKISKTIKKFYHDD